MTGRDDARRDPAGSPAPPTFPGEFPGTDEVPVLDWPRIWRERLASRVHASRRYSTWVLVAALTGMFAAGFTITVLAVSIPQIADDLGASESALTWVVSGPLLTLAIAMPLFGKLGDVHGHRRVYLAGFAAFTVFTLACAFAWSAPVLVVLRVLAALGGAATGPTSMALIMQAFAVEDRVKAMGWWSLVGAGAPVFGVVAGAPVVDAFGWRWLFVGQAPLALGALVVAALVLRETPTRPREPLDVAGAVSLATATVTALLALDRGDVWGWTSPAVVVCALASSFALAAFVRAERRAPHPLLPLEFFRRRNFSASLVAQFGSNFAYMGGFIVSPLLLQRVFGYSLETTGFVMLCRPLTFSLFAPVAGYVTVRVGERRAAIAGTVLVVCSMLVFAAGAVTESVGLVVAALVCSGLGLGASSPSLVSSVANAVDERDLGIANAAQSMVTQIGVVVGIQVMSTIAAGSRDPGPYTLAYVVGAALAAAGVVGATFVRSAARSTARVARAA
ncbi:MAG: MFS transporter [Acidimicrobiia bacterium]|nr:MAG: MFS transporter [Acidimicrobiia bacterium]